MQTVPLCLYLLQLAVNLWAWPPIFVGGPRRRYAFADSAGILYSNLHCNWSPGSQQHLNAFKPPGRQRTLFSIRALNTDEALMHSLPDCVPISAALLGVSLMTMGKFYAVSPAAGFLMLPYLGWTCFATTLINCSLWDSNPAVVQSAHKVAQVRPQGPQEMSQARSLHKRNITCPADLGKINPSNADNLPGSIQYSDQPILGRRSSGEHLLTQAWDGPPAQNTQQSQLHARQLQPQQLQQPWDVRAGYQPAMHTPFAEANLHRRSGTESDRRTTRRTTDDHISSERFVTHTDSGHLIIPQWSGDKPERGNSGLGGSGLFARVGLSLCTCISDMICISW